MKKLYIRQMMNGIVFFAFFALWNCMQMGSVDGLEYEKYLDPMFIKFEVVILIFVLGSTGRYFHMLKEKREGEILYVFPIKKVSLWMNQWLAMAVMTAASWMIGVVMTSIYTGIEIRKWIVPVILRDLIIFTIFMLFQTKIYGKIKALLAWMFCMGLGMCTVFHLFQWMGMIVPLRKYNLYGYFVQGIATIFDNTFVEQVKKDPVWKWMGENQYFVYAAFIVAAVILLFFMVRYGRKLWMQQESQIMNQKFKPITVGFIIWMSLFCIGMSILTRHNMLFAWNQQLLFGNYAYALYKVEYPKVFQNWNGVAWLIMLLSISISIRAAYWQKRR